MGYRLPQYLKSVLEKGALKRVNLVHGEESYLKRALLDKLKERFGQGYTLLWGDEITLGDLIEASAGGNIFSGQGERTVVVLRFEDFLKGVSRKGLEKLTGFLKNFSAGFLYIFVDRKLSKSELSREPFKTISSVGDLILADKLPEAKVKDIVRKKFEREGKGIEEEALELMIKLCNADLAVLRNESEKLISYTEGKKVTLDDVREVCAPWGEYSLFELVDAFFQGKKEQRLVLLKEVLRTGTSPIQILATLTSYALKLYVLHEAVSEGVDPDTAMDSLGIKHSFTKKKLKDYMQSMSRDKAKYLIEALYRIDYNVKVAFSPPDRELVRFALSY